MWESIFKFLGPILQQALGAAASTAVNTGVNQLMTPKPQQPRMAPAQGAGMVPGAPPGVGGSGTTNNPTGTMNFGGGYTGGPDPRQGVGQGAGMPSGGFTTMGFPSTDQSQMKKMLQGRGNEGFQGI